MKDEEESPNAGFFFLSFLNSRGMEEIILGSGGMEIILKKLRLWGNKILKQDI